MDKNVLLRDFLALSPFCCFCNFSWCCCRCPGRFVYKNILKPCQCLLWPVHSALPCWQEPSFSETSCLQWWLEISSYPSLHSCTSPEFSTFVEQDNNHRSIPGIHLLSQLELPVWETTQCVTHGRATAMSIRSCFTPATAMVHLYSTCRISLELELCNFWLFRMSAFAGTGKDFG